MKRLLASSALFAGLLVLLTACGGGGQQPPQSTQGKISGVLVYPSGPPPVQSLLHNGEMTVSSGLEFEARHAWEAGNGTEADGTAEVVPGDVIVFYEAGLQSQNLATEGLATLGVEVAAVRAVAAGQKSAQLYRAEGLDEAETVALAARIATLPGVAAALPNQIRHAYKVPNDYFYPLQWHYGAMNLPAAWDIEDGTRSRVTVAVLDTGIVPHPDLLPNLLPGYDFITDPASGGDGDGRDGDPTDIGRGSQYHGSHVAGTIAAVTNDGNGVAGVSWGAKVVPVRVLGLNGGTTLDIVEAVQWAAGHSVPGVPNNPNPARIINLSLGGNDYEPCLAWTDAIFGQLRSEGVIVVVAAGNENMDTKTIWPASCSNVITVGATGPTNDRAPYSNYGAEIDVMAAGGDTTLSFTIGENTFPAGVMSTVYDDNARDFAYTFMDGTSMASPHIAGIVALMLARDSTLTFEQVKARLRTAANPFDAAKCLRPSGTDCGAGLVDAAKALLAGGGPGPGPGPAPEPPPPPPPPSTQSPITYIAALYCTLGCNDFDYDHSQLTAVEASRSVVQFEIGGLKPGTYVAAAWQDLNGDGEISVNEPFGVSGDINNPQTWFITIQSGEHHPNVMIVMQPLTLSSVTQHSTSSVERANVAAALRELRER